MAAQRSRQVWWAVASFAAIIVLVLGSPVLMARLVGSSLPWDRLADAGDAFGGASALLSAIALCGIGASLIFQQRQVRQELAEIDRQQHLEIIRLAIENPELIEVLNGKPPGPHERHDLFANLTMMYWLSIWELGEIDDEELHALAAVMFQSETTRLWWARMDGRWIGTRRHPERVRFLAIVSGAMAAGASAAAARRPPTDGRAAVLAVSIAAAAALLGASRVIQFAGRRMRSDRTSATNRRQDSAL